MMEAVAFALYDSYRLIVTSGLPINHPIVLNEGGGEQAVAADHHGRVQCADGVGETTHGRSFGDAVLAGVALSLFPDFSVAKRWAEFVAPMEPDPRESCTVHGVFRPVQRLYEHVKEEDFAALADIRDRG